MTTTRVSAAQMLVRLLQGHGVDRAFCVPGESFLAVLDALLDVPEIAVTTCRHEGGATMMADAYAKLTGRPGIVFVTRGPGATNGSSGVHVARQDSSPMIVFIGDVERDRIGRDAFQEVDYQQMFLPLAKWVARVDDPRRLPELVGRAFHAATSGRPGPVVLALPEDMLAESAEAVATRPSGPAQAGLRSEDRHRIETLLSAASRPVVIVGGGGWRADFSERLRSFAEAWELPVCTEFRRQDYFDNCHANYAGNLGLGTNPALVRALGHADLILGLGATLGDATTGGFSLFAVPRPAQTLAMVHPDPEELGRVYQPDLAVNASVGVVLEALAAATPARPAHRRAWVAELNRNYRDWIVPPAGPGSVQMGEIMAWLGDRLPDDAILTNGAGNFAVWPNRFHQYRRYGTMLAPNSGSMGYGVPAAIAAKLVARDRLVVAFEGDGSFLMTGQELATAAREAVAIIVILLNNNMYGTIRMHQEREYPGRVSATALVNPDFQMLARSYGAHAERVATTAEFAPAFERAVGSGRSAIIEVLVDPEAIAPGQTISGLRLASSR